MQEDVAILKKPNKMRKYIVFAVVLVAVLLVAGSAHAAESGCTNLKALNYDSSATVDDGSCKFTVGGGDPMKVVMVWGLDGYHTPRIASGQKDCPAWYPVGCFDLTSTQYYRDQMMNLARELIAKGFVNQFPQYEEWYKIVR